MPAHLRHIERYIDQDSEQVVARLKPGDFYVTSEGEVLVTLLGSCVSACIRDTSLGVGGMNHFMLPDGEADKGVWASAGVSAATRYGSGAMEFLINEILSRGGRRERLEVKLTGGGRVLGIDSDVGERNIRFVREYVRAEGFRLIAEDLGGEQARKVHYEPESGRLRVRHLPRTHLRSVKSDEDSYRRRVRDEAPVGSGSVELF